MTQIAQAPELELRIAWWFTPWLWALVFFCSLHRSEPDMKKVHRTLAKAVKVRVAGSRKWLS